MTLTPEVIEGLRTCGLPPGSFDASGESSLRGPCPRCGGSRRFVIFMNAAFPRWFCQCDGCGTAGWVPAIFPGIPWPAGPREPMPRARESKDFSRALAALNGGGREVIRAMHDGMTEADRQWWRDRGVPDSVQDFLRLGVVHGRPFRRFKMEGVMVLDAYVYPKHSLGWEVRNLDFRMIDPPPGEGKYRPFPGAPSSVFLTRPDMDSLANPTGDAFVVEGSNKAIVLSVLLEGAQVIGVPGASSWADLPERGIEAERVYVMLDSDAWGRARKLCQALGPASRQVTLPVKVDDAIISGALDRPALDRILRLSRKEVTA